MPITTIIMTSNTRARLEGDYDSKKLSKVLSYQPPGYQFMAAFKRHVWDGYIRLLTDNGTFPAGLAWLVEEHLKTVQNVDVQWVWEVERPPLKVRHTNDITLNNIELYPWQKKAVRIALERGRGILKMATGSGKSETISGIIRCLEDERPPKTLVVVPNRNLLNQTADRLEDRLGFRVGRIGYGAWNEDFVTVAIPDTLSASKFSRERRDLFKVTELLLLDECFPAGTLVDGKPIQEVRVGDLVWSFDEETQQLTKRPVVRLWQSTPTGLVRISFANKQLTCTHGHPFLTQRGWVPAAHLTDSDMVLCLTGANSPVQAMRSSSLQDEVAPDQTSSLLRLQSEAKNEGRALDLPRLQQTIPSHRVETNSFSPEGTSVLLDNMQQHLRGGRPRKDNGRYQPQVRLQEDARAQSDAICGGEGEALCNAPSDEMAAADSWRQRSRSSPSSDVVSQHAGVACGGDCADEVTDSVAAPLCLGHSQREAEGGDRGGRRLASPASAKAQGQAQGQILAWQRVVGVAVLESGGDRTFGGMCPDGAVYNLEVEGTHTYLAEGVVVHNCHHAASQKWSTIINKCPAFYRFGFSGTPLDRGDGSDLKLEGATGPLLVDISSALLVKQGRLAKPTVTMLDVRKPTLPHDLDWEDIYSLGIVRNIAFHQKVANIVQKEANNGKQVLVLVTRIAHGEAIQTALSALKGRPHEAPFVHGKTFPGELKTMIDLFKSEKLKVLIASPIFGEGTDLPGIDVLVLADGGRSTIKTVQKAGRAMRPKKGRPNECRIYDFRHHTHSKLLEHSEARVKVYKREDFEVVDSPA